MSFCPEKLLQALMPLAPVRSWWIGYSGGMDSHVLLHAAAAVRERLGAPLHAVHVDHGLHADAGRWSAHCARVCEALAVPLRRLKVDASPRPGESPEAAARAARYAAIGTLLGPDDCLLTAHHQDDQAETLLLQLLRGGGLRGTAAMPAVAPFGPGRIARPLLGFAHVELSAYAAAQDLGWIDDPSNVQTGFDRNFLRHEILPRLGARWPSAAHTLARVAAHHAEAAALLDALAALDLAEVRGTSPNTLSAAGLLGLQPARRRNALRVWIGEAGLPLPSAAQLRRVEEDVLHAARDAGPCVRWPGAELRRYRDLLYAMAPLPAHDRALVLDWKDLQQPLKLPVGGRLVVRPVQGAGLAVERCGGARVTVRFRRGGERCRPGGRGATRPLKHLLQEAGVPPFQRDRIPLIYVGETLAAVPGHWICEPFRAAPGESGLRIEHEPDDDHQSARK
jgi:tRNA(Ile)-lysidine synthase